MQGGLDVLGKALPFLSLSLLTCEVGVGRSSACLWSYSRRSGDHTRNSCGAHRLAQTGARGWGLGDCGARGKGPHGLGTRLSAGSQHAHPAPHPPPPTHPEARPRPPLSLRCALKSQMGPEERGSRAQPPARTWINTRRQPGRQPRTDALAAGTDGRLAGEAGQRLTSKRPRPPAGGALIRPGCRRPAICSALARRGGGAAGWRGTGTAPPLQTSPLHSFTPSFLRGAKPCARPRSTLGSSVPLLNKYSLSSHRYKGKTLGYSHSFIHPINMFF